MLRPQVFPDHEAMSRYAADWLAECLREKPSSIVCLATGATPMRSYELLAQHGTAEPSLFDRMRLVKLDEWGGLPMSDSATCEQHLQSALVTPLGLSDRYIAFDSQPRDPEAECARVARWLDANGPLDVCVLGLGLNGHLGFNEPAEFLQPHAHVAVLSETSLTHAMLNGTTTRPTYGLTLGMADLLQSQRILVLVSGPRKRAPLEQLLAGCIATDFPASLLQLHRDVLLLCDMTARPGVEERGRE